VLLKREPSGFKSECFRPTFLACDARKFAMLDCYLNSQILGRRTWMEWNLHPYRALAFAGAIKVTFL
jgi:hypothetical protein